jgi:oxygen-independent coproporphyrinogen-3 oxidase
MIAAIVREAELQKDYLNAETIETIYLGGGTPSLLSIKEIKTILEKVKSLHNISSEAEITLEANPDDINEDKLTGWKAAGINRLSTGIQSFFDEDLHWMNRAHTARQAKESLSLAKRYFDNITIDLIYGLPGLTHERWKQNVDTILSSGIPHISCYALTVEPKTPLHKMIKLQKSPDVNPDKQSEQFLLLMRWMEEAGYEHYEISNFAKPGFRSRHNSSYWQGKKYLGLGPSAHSFNGSTRQWNISNNNIYTASINDGKVPYEKEELTFTQKINEYIMTSLRTMEGMNLDVLKQKFSINTEEIIRKTEKYINNNLLKLESNSLVLTLEGKLLADGIAADLFY